MAAALSEIQDAAQKERSSANWTVTAEAKASELHDHMTGKTAVITGVSRGGLGAEAARVIALHQPKLLILASRDPANMAEVIADIHAAGSEAADIRAVKLDLASQASVRAAAAEILTLAEVVDVLINNAGVMMLPEYRTTPEGLEMHFGLNHLGHFLLGNLLAPALLRSKAGARVINVSSTGARGSPIRFDDYNFGGGAAYDPFTAYAQSKTANVLFARELARRLGPRGLLAFSLEPGLVGGTNLARSMPHEMMVAQGWFLPSGELNPALPFKTTAQGALGYIVAAYDPVVVEHNGQHLTVGEVDDSLPFHTKDPEAAVKLWELSEKLVGEKFEY